MIAVQNSDMHWVPDEWDHDGGGTIGENDISITLQETGL
jgi:hypothetical protein